MKTPAELLTALVATREADNAQRKAEQDERLRISLLGWGK